MLSSDCFKVGRVTVCFAQLLGVIACVMTIRLAIDSIDTIDKDGTFDSLVCLLASDKDQLLIIFS